MNELIENKINELKDRLEFYESFGSGGKVWIQPTNGPTLQDEISKIESQIEILQELNNTDG